MATGLPQPTSYRVPAPNDLRTLRRSVMSWVGDTQEDNDLVTQADDCIKMAIDEINAKRWKKLIDYYEFSIDSTNSAYDIDADVASPLKLQRIGTDDDVSGTLSHLELQSFLSEEETAGSVGTPTIYSVNESQRQLYLNYTPTEDFIDNYPRLRFWFARYIPYPLSERTVLNLPAQFNAFLKWHGRFNYAAVAGDMRKASMAERRADKQFKELLIQDSDTELDFDSLGARY